MNKLDEKRFKEEFKERLNNLDKGKGLEDRLDLFKGNAYFDYLIFVRNYMYELEDNDMPPYIVRATTGTSIDAYLLGVHRFEPVAEGLIASVIYVDELSLDHVPQINICIPSDKKKEARELLLSHHNVTQITPSSFDINIDNNQGYKFEIHLLENPLLEKLVKLKSLTGIDYKNIPTDDKETIEYMLSLGKHKIYLPPLSGIDSNPGSFYDLMEVSHPTSLFDLAKIECLTRATFKNNNKVKRWIDDYGIDSIFYSKEQFIFLLSEIYDVDKSFAFNLLDSIKYDYPLLENEEMVLQSHEVPPFIIKQFDNVKYLHYLMNSIQVVNVYYLLAYYKLHYPEHFFKIVDFYKEDKDRYVGPFFYINEIIMGEIEPINNKNKNLRFINGDKSHFDLFNELGITGDYGNYPRGRVIYDNMRRFFLVYIDESLDRCDIRDEIILKYNIDEKRVIFLYDEHYTHDDLG